ncbi:flagellar basal-body MS-ring/collar protein FliF [Lysobacter brunescens]|uniref:Flagellar M-ring protein n=1 Tax=Lysobacter brunescens TaxID=262323 RepID=A0ABW2YFP4_9GAMM
MNPLKFYQALERGARIGFAVGALVIVLITAAMLWWLMSPREQLLFGGLKETDAAEIVEALNEWKVPHTIVDGGSGIAVPEEMMYETRMRLVSAGIPRGGAVGFELFDDSDFGVTEFAQRVNYQRALQGEIERTIAALPAVENARVHLTIRRPGLFVGEQEQSKASVAVTLRPGEQLTRNQVRGIRGLVAAAVEGLSVSQVAVLDAAGNLLAGGDGTTGQSFDARDEEESRVESRIQAKVNDLLAQVLNEGDYRVSVDVQLDFDAVRRVNERPMTDDAVVVRKRTNSNSNADAESDAPRQNNEDVEFRHGTLREEIALAPGRVQRVSVAVILPMSMDDSELARIESLIATAAGIDEVRGDRLEVSRLGRGLRFAQREGEAVPPVTAEEASADAVSARAPVRVGFDAQAWPAWSKMLLLIVVGLVLGVTVALALQRRPAKLTPTEREAVLGKMRTWLAEGTLPQ